MEALHHPFVEAVAIAVSVMLSSRTDSVAVTITRSVASFCLSTICIVRQTDRNVSRFTDKPSELGVVDLSQHAELDAGAMAPGRPGHVGDVGGGSHRLVTVRDADLGQVQLFGLSWVSRALPALDGPLQRAGLAVSEEVRPHDAMAAQVGLHLLGAGVLVGRPIDAHGHEIGVWIGVGLDAAQIVDSEQAQPLQRGKGAGDGLDFAVTIALAGGGKQGAGEAAAPELGVDAEVQQEPGGLPEPPTPRHRPQPRRHGSELECFSGCAFYIGRPPRTVRVGFVDATAGGPRKAQLHWVAQQVGPDSEQLGGDRGEARAIDRGEEGRLEPDPAHPLVSAADLNDQRSTCEDSHTFPTSPARGGDAEVGRDLKLRSAAVECGAAGQDRAQGRRHLPGDPGAAGASRDVAGGDPEALVQGSCSAGLGLGRLDVPSDARPNRVGARGSAFLPRSPAPKLQGGLVNRVDG